MRARTVLLGSVVLLLAIDAGATMLFGTHLVGGTYHVARMIVCGACAFLIARRSGRLGNTLWAVSASFLAVCLAVLVSTAVYVLLGGPAANRHRPALLLAYMVIAILVGALGGGAGTMAGWYAHWQAHREPAGGAGDALHGVLRRPRRARRKFP